MENKNGQGIFLGVIGVATLVVAIIGATFAYFTASTNTTGDAITGETLTVGGTNLSLDVDRIEFSGASAPSLNLVPAVMTEDYSGYTAALTANCEAYDHSYTGCHLYRIKAHTASNLTGATIALSAMQVTATTASNWKYVVYKGAVGTGETATATTAGTSTQSNVVNADILTTTPQVFSNTSPYGTYTILNAGTLEAGDTIWYLLVYLKNVDSTQNDGVTNGTTSETGTYSGTVALTLADGGQIKATFTSSQQGT